MGEILLDGKALTQNRKITASSSRRYLPTSGCCPTGCWAPKGSRRIRHCGGEVACAPANVTDFWSCQSQRNVNIKLSKGQKKRVALLLALADVTSSS
ncbi:hypothetical protein ACNKHS_13470 [Shigella flexneri]